jgi:GTP-binding protein
VKVVSTRFVKSALQPADYPRDRKPEIAFVGRSNVGKSSLLNSLLQRKGLAKTSKTPGKTRTVNFFEVNEKFYFVDLPGYGFAKVSREMKAAWSRVISAYLRDREPLRLAVHLIDSRHPPMANDFELLELLEAAQVPTLIVATKVDKLKRNQRAGNFRELRDRLELGPEAEVVAWSAVTGEGAKQLWGIIEELI